MTLSEQLDRLASFEPTPFPVVSLYLNTQADQHGKDQHQTFVRKELKSRAATFACNSPERDSLDRDVDRIAARLGAELDPATNGVAIFACSGADLFELIQTAAPIERHWLSIGDRPHLYPLARIESQHPTYAVVLADTNSSRILVFSAAELVNERAIAGVKTRRGDEGGWSAKRFQRHVENFHLHHIKDLMEALDRIVREEKITQILVAGDEVVIPLIREQMPKHLAERVVERMRVPAHAPLNEVIQRSLDAMTRVNERTDREKVEAAVGEYRAGALGVVGPDDTLDALVKGQVDELLLSASLRDLKQMPGGPAVRAAVFGTDVHQEAQAATAVAGEAAEAGSESVRIADALVTGARQTAASITFIEDTALLSDYGGAAALLRFRI